MTDLCHWPRSNPSQLHCQPPALPRWSTWWSDFSLLQIIKFVKIPRPTLLTTSLLLSVAAKSKCGGHSHGKEGGTGGRERVLLNSETLTIIADPQKTVTFDKSCQRFLSWQAALCVGHWTAVIPLTVKAGSVGGWVGTNCNLHYHTAHLQ